MKWPLLLSLVAFTPFVLSNCGGSNESEFLDVVISPNSSYILPGTSDSCVDKATDETSGSVQPYRLDFPVLGIQWRKPNSNLHVALIRLKFSSPHIGEYKCEISGDELSALLGKEGAVLSAGTYRSDSTTKDTGFQPCAFRCGGVSIGDSTPSFRARGKVEVIGFSVNADISQSQDQSPERAEFSVNLEYSK